jgi:hypothetical protein
MTGDPSAFLPPQLAADDQPLHLRAVSSDAGDEMVLLPRHIADAAYHVLQAIHALKDNGSQELLTALGKALNKHTDWRVDAAPPCPICAVEVHHGLPHTDACTSDDALAHRSAAVPGLAPED